MSDNSIEKKEKLLTLIKEAVDADADLRNLYTIGNKFKFIHDRLNALKNQVEEDLKALHKKEEKTIRKLDEEDVLVYVSLYNAQGNVVKTWQKLMNPAVFYEYSVNRPIYKNKKDIESFIRLKQNKLQHGYLTIAVNKNDILSTDLQEPQKDSLGGVLIKVREGSLKFDRLINFTHNGNDYVLSETGELVKSKKDS